ncbi:MAG: UDP-N-acetyl-D-glucosamine dehydrogenase, partial [Solirubrobacteraceae bacterium]|nr:UDP-N-acetyl-D-glucosamine dehydrogenase [Solirubrobacteraceae bacterium]
MTAPADTPSTVGVVGLGYVGLPLAVALAEAGMTVVALDNDPTKIAALRRGESYVEDVPASALEPLRERIRPTTRYA